MAGQGYGLSAPSSCCCALNVQVILEMIMPLVMAQANSIFASLYISTLRQIGNLTDRPFINCRAGRCTAFGAARGQFHDSCDACVGWKRSKTRRFGGSHDVQQQGNFCRSAAMA